MHNILETFKVQIYSTVPQLVSSYKVSFVLFFVATTIAAINVFVSHIFLYKDVLVRSEILGSGIVNRKICVVFHFNRT